MRTLNTSQDAFNNAIDSGFITEEEAHQLMYMGSEMYEGNLINSFKDITSRKYSHFINI